MATVVVPRRVAPPPVTWAVTCTLAWATGLPLASSSRATGWVERATPLWAWAGGWTVITTPAAGPALPVAVKLTGLPAIPLPAAVAVTVLPPAAVPRVQEVSVATPLALVATDALLPLAAPSDTLPPPWVTRKVTVTPGNRVVVLVEDQDRRRGAHGLAGGAVL